MPSYNAQYFGTKFMGLNYGLILSAWGLAGLIGPIFAARSKDLTGSFTCMLPVIAIVLLMSVILPFITKKPGAKAGAHPHSPQLGVKPFAPALKPESTMAHKP
jgi:OFA family oxalate/formate antiporter-like MFS transporter